MGKQTLRARYPVQFTVMLSAEVAARLEAEAEQQGVSRGELARLYIDEGIAQIDAEAS